MRGPDGQRPDGTGKTAGFTRHCCSIWITHQPHASVVARCAAILTPTRELAAQIGENVRDYSKYLNIRSLVVFGGVSINPQMMNCAAAWMRWWRRRSLDLEHQNAVKLDQIEILVPMKPTACWIWLHSRHSSRKRAKLPAKRQNVVLRRLPTTSLPAEKAVAQPAGNRSGAPQHGLTEQVCNAARALCR